MHYRDSNLSPILRRFNSEPYPKERARSTTQSSRNVKWLIIRCNTLYIYIYIDGFKLHMV